MSQDQSYYAARATQERRLAMAATNPAARSVHLELAAEYTRLAGTGLDLAEKTPDDEQRTA